MPRHANRGLYSTATVGMRVRLLKRPAGKDAEDFDLSRYEVGGVYEVGPRLAGYLVSSGYAEPVEERRAEAADAPGSRSLK